MTTTFRSMSQLKNQTWVSREAAVAELKRNSFPERGADYEVGETSSGSGVWFLREITDAPQEAPRAKKTKKQHPADKAAEEKVSKATKYAVHFRLSPDKRFDEDRDNLAEAIQLAQKWNAEHRHTGRRAIIYAMVEGGGPGEPVKYDAEKVPGILREIMEIAGCDAEQAARLHTRVGIDGLDFSACTAADLRKAVLAAMNGQKSDAKPEPAEPSKEPENDMSALPANGPYGLQFADHLAQHSILTSALAWSKATGERLAIVSGGKVLRIIDGRLGGKKPTRTATKVATRTPRGGESKQGRAIDLLSRPSGATAAELRKATDWPIGQRHINKLAKISGKKIKQLGDERWALV